MKSIASLAFLMFLVSASASARTWTDVTGRTMEADIVRADVHSVTVMLNDREVKIPRSRLSEADNEYCDRWLENLGTGGEVEEPEAEEPAGRPPAQAAKPGEAEFDGKPLVTGGKVNVFEYDYPPELAETVKKKYKSEATGYRIGLAVPNGFDPEKPQRVFVANTAVNNAKQGEQGNTAMAGFFSKQCAQEGWVTFAFDTNIGRSNHDDDMRQALIKMEEVWPRFRQWEFVVGGFSGGGKACFYPAAYMLKEGYRVTGAFLANTNEDRSEDARKQYGVAKSAYKDMRVFWGSGKWDPIAGKETAERMEKSLKRNGMKEVRVEFHEGKHSLYHPQFIEALQWFEQGG